MDEPLLSVVLPVHNAMPYLPEAVGSILGQTLGRLELIAVDDGSTDGSGDYLRGHGDPRVRVLRPGRVGLVGALNLGISRARTGLIARMDGDDIAEATRLARQHEALESGGLTLVSCQALAVDPLKRPIRRAPYPLADAAIRWRLLSYPPFIHSGALYRRDSVEAVGGYREPYGGAEDYDLWERLAAGGRFGNLPETLMQFRVHGASTTAHQSRRVFEASIRIACRAVGDLVPETSAAHAESFVRIVRHEEMPPRDFARILPSLVADLERRHAERWGDDPEAGALMRRDRKQIARLCMHFARLRRFDPRHVASWIKAARALDPQVGLSRRLRELLPGPGAVRRRLRNAGEASPSTSSSGK